MPQLIVLETLSLRMDYDKPLEQLLRDCELREINDKGNIVEDLFTTQRFISSRKGQAVVDFVVLDVKPTKKEEEEYLRPSMDMKFLTSTPSVLRVMKRLKMRPAHLYELIPFAFKYRRQLKLEGHNELSTFRLDHAAGDLGFGDAFFVSYYQKSFIDRGRKGERKISGNIKLSSCHIWSGGLQLAVQE